MSIFESIVEAFVTELEKAPTLSGKVTNTSTRAVSESVDVAVNVSFDGAKPTAGAINGAPVDWNVRVAVDLYAKSDLAMSALLKTVYERIAADRSLSGLVDDAGEPDIEPVYDAAAQRSRFYRLTYYVQCRTNNNAID